jgi:hypothetical protein
MELFDMKYKQYNTIHFNCGELDAQESGNESRFTFVVKDLRM